jgi:hypothetical protein
MKTRLFAAIDESGNVRFVGEVDRGAACGCYCPVCSSPLVAKQGQVKDWHFAHEPGQERVECEAGAMNMLRRVMAEAIQVMPPVKLPLFECQVVASSPTKVVVEPVSWNAQFELPSLRWSTDGMRSKPFLAGQLSSGAPFEAYAVVAESMPRRPEPSEDLVARLGYWVPMPSAETMSEGSVLKQFIRNRGRWVWLSHPDHMGLLAAARQKAQRSADEAYQQLKERMLVAQKRLAEIQAQSDAARLSRQVQWSEQLANKARSEPDSSERWAPGRKPSSSFVCYELKEGQGMWAIYQRSDGVHLLVPVPPALEGWDELFPPSLGQVRDHLGYEVKNLPTALSYLATRAKSVRTSSNADEVKQWRTDLPP